MQRADKQFFESLLGPLDQDADWDLIRERVWNLSLNGATDHDLTDLREKLLRAHDRGIILAAVRALLNTGESASWRLVFEALRDLDEDPACMNLGGDVFSIINSMIHTTSLDVRSLLGQLSSDADSFIADEAQGMIEDLD